MIEYRTYCMKPQISGHPDPCKGTIVLENSGYDWRYDNPNGRSISLESLGKDGWRLISVLPARDWSGNSGTYSVGIFERVTQ